MTRGSINIICGLLLCGLVCMILFSGCVNEEDRIKTDEAIDDGNPELCDNVSDMFYRVVCRLRSGTAPRKVKRDFTAETERVDTSSNAGDRGICGYVTNQDSRDECISRVATSTEDLDLCTRISDPGKRDKCVAEIAWLEDDRLRKRAYKENDAKYCLEMSNETAGYECVQNVALSKYDPAVCELIPDKDYRNHCLSIARDDLSICGRIENVSLRDKCIGTRVGFLRGVSRELCEMVRDIEYRDRCFMKFRDVSGDASACEEISSKESRDKCFFYSAMNGDISYCRKIGDTQFGLYCEGEVLRNLSACLRINDTTYRDDCIVNYFYSVDPHNMTLCDMLSGRYRKDLCIESVAVKLLNDSLCDLIETSQPRESCNREIAISLGNISICDKIDSPEFCRREVLKRTTIQDCTQMDEYHIGDCYYYNAMQSGDAAYCEKISGAYRGACFYQLALKTGDASLCVKAGEVLREKCTSELATAKDTTQEP